MESDEAAPSHRWEGNLDPHGEVELTLNLGGNGGREQPPHSTHRHLHPMLRWEISPEL
jgi:hypothetical protein